MLVIDLVSFFFTFLCLQWNKIIESLHVRIVPVSLSKIGLCNSDGRLINIDINRAQ